MKNRLKRSSFVHKSKRLFPQHHEALPKGKTSLSLLHMSELEQQGIQVYASIPQVTQGNRQGDVVRMAIIKERNLQEARIQVYTWPAGELASWQVSLRDRQQSVNVKAGNVPAKEQTEALMQAASLVQIDDLCQLAVVFSDALSVLQALEYNNLQQPSKALQQACRNRRTVLQWIPAQVEYVETAGRMGWQKEETWRSIRQQRRLQRGHHQITPEATDRLTRLPPLVQRSASDSHETPHWPQPAQPPHQQQDQADAFTTCPCGQEDQTKDHTLRSCSLLQEERQGVWSRAAQLKTKLYDSRP